MSFVNYMSYVSYMNYVSYMSYVDYMSYVGRLYEIYELCTSYDMSNLWIDWNHSKSHLNCFKCIFFSSRMFQNLFFNI